MTRSLVPVGGRSGRIDRGAENIWNIFTQVLLPLVILLTFVAMIDIDRYRQATENTKSHNHELQQKIDKITTEQLEGIAEAKYQRAVIEIQRQRLINALEKTALAQRATFQLDRFRSGAEVDLVGAMINDDIFKMLCQKVRAAVFDDTSGSAKHGYWDKLYVEILKQAEVRDPQGSRVGDLNGKPWPAAQTDLKAASAAEVMLAQADEIFPANRAYVHNRIIEATNAMLDDLERLQREVLGRIYEALIVEPEALKGYSRNLVTMMLDPNATATEREGHTRNFYLYQNKRLEDQLADAGYPFLRSTWNKVNQL